MAFEDAEMLFKAGEIIRRIGKKLCWTSYFKGLVWTYSTGGRLFISDEGFIEEK